MEVTDAGAYIRRYQTNYPLWMKEMLGADITADQRVVSDALMEHHFVSAKSGTGTGKTAVAATTALWFLTTRPESKVVCTAPTGHQLEDLLFAEMETWSRRIKLAFIRESITIIKGKIFIKGFRDWYIAARTIPKDTKDKLGDVLAGFHAPHLLFIVDEASGVPDPVYKGIEGSMMQKNVFCLLVGNPTRNIGYFYDTHNKHKERWARVTLSSMNSPFSDLDWIERMRELHGEDSDFFRTKVLGVFPIGGGSAIVTIDQVRAAMFRRNAMLPAEIDAPIVAGLDPAAGLNDYSVLTIRRGCYIFDPVRIKHTDTVDLIPEVVSQCRKFHVSELYTEYNGLGIGIYDQLKRKRYFKTFRVVMNARGNNPEAYRNIRAELYFGLRDNFDFLGIGDHDRYIHELPEISIDMDKEPAQLEDKKQLRSRLGFSPDYSDSLTLSTYRHFDLGRLEPYSLHDPEVFSALNQQLIGESDFEKI